MIDPYCFPGIEPDKQLMENIQKDIDKAGGYYIWRDEAIMENIRGYNKEHQLVKVRLNYRMRDKGNRAVYIKRSSLRSA